MRREPNPLSEPTAEVVGSPHQAITAELQALCDAFFRSAGPTVHAELRQFLTDRGYHPHASIGWFIDALGFTTLSHNTDTDSTPTL